VEEARKHLEERVRKIAEAKVAKRVKEEVERKKRKAVEKAEAECKQREAEEIDLDWRIAEAERRELEHRERVAEQKEKECRAHEATEEEEMNQRITKAKRAVEAVWKVKVAKAPPTTKVSPGVLLWVQIRLTSQQHKVQETVEVSNSTEAALPLVSATLEAPELTNLAFVEEEESASGSSGASVHNQLGAL
jgi:hypothetical protein